MLPDALPQLIEMLLRLSRLETAQLWELIQHLPDPQAAAAEMLCRGWITQDQFSSLFSDPQQPPPRETMLVGFGDDESAPDAGGDNWDLPVSDEEDKADVAPEVEWARPDRTDEEMPPEPETVESVPVLSGAARTPQFEWDMLVLPVAGGNEARRRESDRDKLLRRWMGWASKGLLIWALFLGGFFAGLPLFRANSMARPVARQESRETKKKTQVPIDKRGVSRPQITAPKADKVANNKGGAGDPARAVDLPPLLPIVPSNIAKQFEDVRNRIAPNGQPAAPVAAEARVGGEAPARANDAKPKSTASLYARVRQVVLENKTEETERLGIGDFAYQNVPDNGSIMVGMEVTYAPFFTHQIIKSVRPIYQRPDGTRYEGPVCGNPTQVGERVVAKGGYAIGGAAIKAGMGIDGMQLTFMEIGADGLNPNKTYLSKWLGGYGGADAKTFVNDGRPIVGIAGMRSRDPKSPAFCMCLVTTKAGAIAGADGPSFKSSPATRSRATTDMNSRGQNGQPPAPVAGPMAAPQVGFPAQAVPLDTVAFEQMVRQNQEKVRQQILQTQQQILQRHQVIMQTQQQQIMRGHK